MTRDKLLLLAEETMEMVDPALLPQTDRYLSAVVTDVVEDDAYTMATRLMESDRSEPLPRFLINTIIELLDDAASEGDAEAMNDLGSHFYSGRRGFPQSFGKAMRLYELAAKNGSATAQENLGYCHYYGRFGEPDYEAAFRCFALGAFAGRPISLYKIGDMYRYGQYVEQDEIEALRIYRHCAELLNEENEGEAAGPVYLRIGDMLLEGHGEMPDPETALWAYQQAERYLGAMVRAGDTMYRKSMERAIAGQEKARAALARREPTNSPHFL